MVGQGTAEGTGEEQEGREAPDVPEVKPLPWWSYFLVIALWIAATRTMEAFDVTQEAPYLYLLAALFSAFGLLCAMNGHQCGAIHCRLSGPAYILLGVVALAAALGLIALGQRPLLWAWFGIFVVAYGAEFIVEEGGFRSSTG